MILVAAALFTRDGDGLMARASDRATSTRDRQLVAIAAAHLRGRPDLVDALARDHLVDHPDNVLVAWIAGASHRSTARPKPEERTWTAVHRSTAHPRRGPGHVAFTALGAIFDYPDVLDEPAGQVLASFRDREDAVSAWFAVLALSAALLAPVAIGVGRLSPARAMRIAVPVGIAAAVVQVIGLLRWPILVPGYASDAASANAGVAADGRDAFTTASDILGTALGETVGYLLTATWTVLVVVALGGRSPGAGSRRWARSPPRSYSPASSRRSDCP